MRVCIIDRYGKEEMRLPSYILKSDGPKLYEKKGEIIELIIL